MPLFFKFRSLLPSRGLLAQTQGRELPKPEPPAAPVWTSPRAGGSAGREEGRARGAAAAFQGSQPHPQCSTVHLHLCLRSSYALLCFTPDDTRALIGHEEIHQAAAWCSCWVPTASGSCCGCPKMAQKSSTHPKHCCRR